MKRFEYEIRNGEFAFLGDYGDLWFTTKTPAMLFDGGVMLKHGDVEKVMPYYNDMKRAADKSNLPFDLFILTFDTVNEETCEEINKLLHCTGYVETFLKKCEKQTA